MYYYNMTVQPLEKPTQYTIHTSTQLEYDVLEKPTQYIIHTSTKLEYDIYNIIYCAIQWTDTKI